MKLTDKLQNIMDDAVEHLYISGADLNQKKHMCYQLKEALKNNCLITDMREIIDEMITNIRCTGKQEMEQLNEKCGYLLKRFQDVSVLVIDDFQFVLNKSSMQMELYYLLKYRAEKNLSTILFSDLESKKEITELL